MMKAKFLQVLFDKQNGTWKEGKVLGSRLS